MSHQRHALSLAPSWEKHLKESKSGVSKTAWKEKALELNELQSDEYFEICLSWAKAKHGIDFDFSEWQSANLEVGRSQNNILRQGNTEFQTPLGAILVTETVLNEAVSGNTKNISRLYELLGKTLDFESNLMFESTSEHFELNALRCGNDNHHKLTALINIIGKSNALDLAKQETEFRDFQRDDYLIVMKLNGFSESIPHQINKIRLRNRQPDIIAEYQTLRWLQYKMDSSTSAEEWGEFRDSFMSLCWALEPIKTNDFLERTSKIFSDIPVYSELLLVSPINQNAFLLWLGLASTRTSIIPASYSEKICSKIEKLISTDTVSDPSIKTLALKNAYFGTSSAHNSQSKPEKGKSFFETAKQIICPIKDGTSYFYATNSMLLISANDHETVEVQDYYNELTSISDIDTSIYEVKNSILLAQLALSSAYALDNERHRADKYFRLAAENFKNIGAKNIAPAIMRRKARTLYSLAYIHAFENLPITATKYYTRAENIWSADLDIANTAFERLCALYALVHHYAMNDELETAQEYLSLAQSTEKMLPHKIILGVKPLAVYALANAFAKNADYSKFREYYLVASNHEMHFSEHCADYFTFANMNLFNSAIIDSNREEMATALDNIIKCRDVYDNAYAKAFLEEYKRYVT
ncbi:hypothetical protein [Litorimonas sp.]|uniref:hypothetical protein n=1 Tax=Litorimonas sp. TaxID=1892381 RepID=UPI003A837E1A